MALRFGGRWALALALLGAWAPPGALGEAPRAVRQWCERVCQCSAFDPLRRTLPPGYLAAPGVGAYKLHTATRTWQAANDTCGREGGHLAIPDDKSELDTLMSLRHGIKDVLIGFTNLFDGNNFETAIGTPMNDFQQSLWYSGYPKTAANRNAVLLYQNGQIWDHRNDQNYPFLCELSHA